MLTNQDFKDIKHTQAIIEHIKDGSPNRITLDKLIQILEFILTQAAAIMFTKEGKPKNTIQLVGSIFQIIGFIRDLIRMITGEAKKSGPKVDAGRIAGKTVKAIRDGVDKSRDNA
jgi:hypothetical protein